MISETVLHSTELLFGLGVQEDWRFEEEFKRKAGCSVICFDHTITAAYWKNRFKIDFIDFVRGRRLSIERIKDMLKYLEYRRFFDGKSAIHYQTMIGYPSIGAKDVHQLMAMSGDKKVFFKIDIEGGEYRIFDQLVENSKRIVGFIIEFHDVDLHRERISKLIESTRKDFELVHIHANNYGGTDPNGDPLVIEMTWIRKDMFVPSHDLVERCYPVADLDYPNNPRGDDIPIRFDGDVNT